MYRGYDRENSNSEPSLDPVTRRPVYSKENVLGHDDTANAYCAVSFYPLLVAVRNSPVNPRKITWTANTVVTSIRGFGYAASKYTFSPPLRGMREPSSIHIKRPQYARIRPATQSAKAAPALPTLSAMADGVEKIAVPIMRFVLNKLARGSNIRKLDLTLRRLSIRVPSDGVGELVPRPHARAPTQIEAIKSRFHPRW